MLIDPWRITMLGRFEARMGERIVTRFPSHKAGVLLACLALSPDRKYGRDDLIVRLWPENDLEDPLLSLRVVLSSLRTLLEPNGVPKGEVLEVTRTTILLRSEAVTTDVADFNVASMYATNKSNGAQVRKGWCERAIQLYGGGLLPGYSDSWVEAEREGLQRQHRTVLHELSDLHLAEGDPIRAVYILERIVAHYPEQEEAHYDLIRLLIDLDRPHSALQQFRSLEEILRKETGRKPSPITFDLIQPLLKDRLSSVSSESVSRPRSGKKREQAEERTQEAATAVSGSEPISRPLPIPQRQHRLPLYLDLFFGREDECVTLCAWLTEGESEVSERRETEIYEQSEKEIRNRKREEPVRLVTVIGPAGSGKTRLVIETAKRLSESFSGLIGFVSLADLSGVDDIVMTARDALCPELEASGADPLRQIAETLGDAPALLILDNYEHLLPDGAEAALRLLEAAPGLRLLVTSRRALELHAEHLMPLGPLPVPQEGSGRSAEDLSSLQRYPGIQLFVVRSHAKRPDFRLSAHNARTVAELCRRLDGLPLAIELAAARSGALTPTQMLKQLEDRFRFLVSRYADQPERHRSLYLAIDSSYSALPPDLQRFFAQLSVFRGGFTLEACDAISGVGSALAPPPSKVGNATPMPSLSGSSPRSVTTLDLLTELQESSLIVAEAQGETMRFRLLESTQEFARHRLMEEGDYDATCRSLLDYFLGFAEVCAPLLDSTQQHDALQKLTLDQENLRWSLGYSLATGQWNKVVLLVCTLTGYWYRKGLHREGNDWFERVLAEGTRMPDELRRKALYGGAIMAFLCADYAIAESYWTECLEMSRVLEDEPGALRARGNLGNVAIAQKDYSKARSLFETCLTSFRAQGNDPGVALALANLAVVARAEEDYPLACTRHQESIEIFRRLDDRHNLTLALNNLADTLIFCKDYVAAHPVLVEALNGGLAQDNPRHLAHSLSNFLTLAIGENCIERAALLIGAMETLRDRIQFPLPSSAQSDYRREREAAVQSLGEARFAEVWLIGSRMSQEELSRYLLA